MNLSLDGSDPIFCPWCAADALFDLTDSDGDRFVGCPVCREIFVSPSYADRDRPTLRYPLAEEAAEIEAQKAKIRSQPVRDDRGQVAALGGYVPLNP